MFRSPADNEVKRIVRAKLDCKYLCEFFNPKWSKGCDHALEKSTGMLEFFFRDPLQHPFVRVIQGGG
jgi:hypothetical protein